MKRKLFFDLDGTLVDNYSSWTALHEEFKTQKQAIEKNYKAWLVHQDAHRWVQDDLILFRGKTYYEIVDAFDGIEFFEGVKNWFPKLQETFDVYLISGGFGLFVEYCASQLDIPYDRLIYHSIYADGDEWKVDDDRSFNDKSIIKKYEGYKIAVGNSLNDIDMFKEAELSVGFNINPKKRDKILPHITMEFRDFSELALFLIEVEL